jgi:DNA-directed RNA polymerase subunit RPC12/RpoP
MKYNKGKRSGPGPQKDKVVIDTREYEGPEVTTYICNRCSRTLSRLSDSSGNNVSYYCNSCSIEYNLDNQDIRHKQKLEVPDRNIEPAVSTTPGIPDISIRHEPELKDGALALSKKGTIRFTHYEDSSQR